MLEFQNVRQLILELTTLINLSISTASPPLGDYVQVCLSGVLMEEMLLKIKKSWIKDDRVKM